MALHRKRQPNMDKLLAQIAAVTGESVEELKEVAEATKDKYTSEERTYQKEAVINFFHTRIANPEPKQRQGESNAAFAKRYADWQKSYNSWKFKTCKACGQEFVYAYNYEGVAHCSNECQDASLRQIGLELTVGRDLKMRWGIHHPAVVPASVLSILREVYESSEAISDALGLSIPPKSPTEYSQTLHNHDTQYSQDNLGNTA